MEVKFLKLPFYFVESDEVMDKYNEQVKEWEKDKERHEDMGIPFREPMPEPEEMPKVLQDKYVNLDFIENFWEGTEDQTTIQMADGIDYTFPIKFEEFLNILPKGVLIN